MADFKRRTLILSTGKQIKMYGTGIGIGKTFELGEAYAPNIFSCIEEKPENKSVNNVSNPHGLTAEELHEIADFIIRLWIEFKDNLRKYGADNPRIFNVEKQSEDKIPDKRRRVEKHGEDKVSDKKREAEKQANS